MIIGALVLLALISIGVLWVEGTKTGERFINWVSKSFMDINIETMEN